MKIKEIEFLFLVFSVQKFYGNKTETNNIANLRAETKLYPNGPLSLCFYTFMRINAGILWNPTVKMYLYGSQANI